jgi:hypothetical protein
VINIADSTLSLTLSNVNCSLDAPITVTNSTLHVSIQGENALSSEGSVLLCLAGSNITFTGTAQDALFAASLDANATAIGTNGTCGRLTFQGGRFNFSSDNAPGIGTSSWVPNNVSMDAIIIEDAQVVALTLNETAAIGAGRSAHGVMIGEIILRRSLFEVNTFVQCLIGLTESIENSVQTIDRILIEDSPIEGEVTSAGIGTGDSRNRSSQQIGAIEITNSSIQLSTSLSSSMVLQRAAIGGGRAWDTSRQTIDLIAVTASHLSFHGFAVGIGGGYSFDSAGQTIDTIQVSSESELSINADVGIGLRGAEGGESSVSHIIIENSAATISSLDTCIGGGEFFGASKLKMEIINVTGSVLTLC